MRALILVLCCVALGAAQRSTKPATHTVTMDGTSFNPATLTIKAGDSVVWVNKDVVSHTATAQEAKGFNSGTVAPGKSWKHVFKTKGDFPYICTFHSINMKGTLKVQ